MNSKHMYIYIYLLLQVMKHFKYHLQLVVTHTLYSLMMIYFYWNMLE